jgi:hypothetical protein
LIVNQIWLHWQTIWLIDRQVYGYLYRDPCPGSQYLSMRWVYCDLWEVNEWYELNHRKEIIWISDDVRIYLMSYKSVLFAISRICIEDCMIQRTLMRGDWFADAMIGKVDCKIKRQSSTDACQKRFFLKKHP